MRMRRMRNLEPRMDKCADYRIAAPEEMKGKWLEGTLFRICDEKDILPL